MPSEAESRSSPMQSASAGTSSSTINNQPPAPNYLSAKSADTILSEMRPTRIKSEALRSVNVLLDELLWLILGHARSFSTDRLRAGLLKMLPTVLGKNALLEAEVELRAYLDRNPPIPLLPNDETSMQKFPLQPAFELLRMKCEGYSSLGDQEDDNQTETLLYTRMVQATGDDTPKIAAIAPAALYLTAILEHVCEHVLSNVGRVVASDSSRTTAHSQDLYVALCEDESIYPLFKTMKVQEQIEQQSKMIRPSRRSKSSSRIESGSDSLGRTTPPDAPAVPSKSRPSIESAVSANSSTQPPRSSMEKAKSKVLFRAGSNHGADNRSGNGAFHRRSNSFLGEKKAPAPIQDNSPHQDEEAAQNFDDLMRSGTTMKVSLTPDRLKTFEVFAKEKNMRASRLPNSGKETSLPPSSFSNTSQPSQRPSQPTRSRVQVTSISEAPEIDSSRARAASVSNLAEGERPPSASRSRSFTDTRSSQAQPSARGELPAMPFADQEPPVVPRKGGRRAPARNRESLDLDDIMNGVEEESTLPSPKKLILTPKDAKASSETRDLLAFLSEGPPEPPPSAPVNASFGDRTNAQKHGRFRTIVSRLTGSSSNERLALRPADDLSDPAHRSGLHDNLHPKPGSLHGKRSVPNVATLARPPHPSSFSHGMESSSSGSRTRHPSMSRKAVPPWDPTTPRADLPSPVKPVPPNMSKPLPPNSLPSTDESNVQEPTSPISLSRKRPPYDVGSSANGNSKPSSPVSATGPKYPNGHTIPDIGKPANPDGGRIEKQVLPLKTITVPTEDYVRDFQRLMAQATSVHECRVLTDMFLARCGVKFEKDMSIALESSMNTVTDIQESALVEALLGDENWQVDIELSDDTDALPSNTMDGTERAS